MDLSYFADIRFLLFALSNFFLYFWYDVPYVYLADYAVGLQINKKDASMLISSIGIVNMFGEVRLCFIYQFVQLVIGFDVDFPWLVRR